MADVYDLIGEAEARAEYAVHRALGKRFLYSNRSSAGVYVWGNPSRVDASMQVVLETRSEAFTRTFWIAAQTASDGSSFPPQAGLTEGDVITYEGQHYSIKRWTDKASNSGLPSASSRKRGIYQIEAVCTKPKQIGQIS